MSKKKKQKAPEAQQLIDSLLDENTSAAKKRPGFDSTAVGASNEDDDIDFSVMSAGDLPNEIILEDGSPMRVRDESVARPAESNENTAFAHLDNPPTLNLSLDDSEEGDGERTNVLPFASDKKETRPKVDLSAETFSSPPTADASEDEALEAGLLEEKTVRLSPPQKQKPVLEELFPERSEAASPQKGPVDRSTSTEIKPGAYGAHQSKRPTGGSAASSVFTSAEAALKQSESLRIAQSRITDLERELERLRRENERLASAGETLRRRSDELLSKIESAESQSRDSQRILEEEKRVIRGQLSQKDRENAELRQRLDEMENRLESNFKKIRVRERELEHRLEIIKMESATLVSTKDKMILELKRQVDQLTHENEYGKQKSQELFNQYKDKQDTIRRVVRALRIALTILEGDEENKVPFKKAE